MADPVFLLQLVDAQTGEIVTGPAGVVDVNLRRAIRDSVQRRGVGVFRTTAHVLAAIDAALHEATSVVKKAARSHV